MTHPSTKFQALDGVLLGVALTALGVAVTVRLLVVPSFVVMFTEFGGELPVATLIALSSAFAVLVLVLVTLLAAGGAALSASGRRAHGRAALVSALVIAVLSIA